MNRYSAVAITLHWLMAITIAGLVAVGMWMSDAIHVDATKAAAFQAYQWHKSFGLTILILTLLRLVWRMMHPAPPLPAGMAGWERMAARASHFLFYVLMLAIPLSGWAMVSASPFGLPTMFFGLFEWPHIGPLTRIADKAAAKEVFEEVHEILAFSIVGLLLLHIGAALKHHFIARDDVLSRMLPWIKQRI